MFCGGLQPSRDTLGRGLQGNFCWGSCGFLLGKYLMPAREETLPAQRMKEVVRCRRNVCHSTRRRQWSNADISIKYNAILNNSLKVIKVIQFQKRFTVIFPASYSTSSISTSCSCSSQNFSYFHEKCMRCNNHLI